MSNEIRIPEKWLTKYKKEIKDYVIISPDNINTITLGSHIKYITYDGVLKNGGFLIKLENNDRFDRLVFIVKSNIVYRLHYPKNFYMCKIK